ncbi:MAG TPA: hypothetical protein DCS93_17910 [Microscillaceae bacterium]|nr:hypothetical protein [Microscillaceae bacterium]
MIERVYDIRYVNQWRRLWALFIDLFLYLVFFVPGTFALLLISFEQSTIGYFAIYLVLLLLFFQVYLTVSLGGSVGKLTTNIKVVNRQKKYIAIWQAVVRTLPFWVAAIYLIAFLNYILDHLPSYEYPTSIQGAFWVIVDQGRHFFNSIWIIIVLGVLLVDHILALFTPARQTLHDLFAGTYAITRASYYSQAENKQSYRQQIVGAEITLQNYRSNCALEKHLPRKAIVKKLLVSENDSMRLYLIEFEQELKVEGRGEAARLFVVQLQDEHTTLQSGRNQVVFLLSLSPSADWERNLGIAEQEMQFLDFVVVA